MEIGMKKLVPVNVKTVSLNLKVRDEFACTILDQDGAELKDYDGYVPFFMPGQHYGDYVMLEIDIDTGMITNWVAPNAEDMQNFINGEDEE